MNRVEQLCQIFAGKLSCVGNNWDNCSTIRRGKIVLKSESYTIPLRNLKLAGSVRRVRRVRSFGIVAYFNERLKKRVIDVSFVGRYPTGSLFSAIWSRFFTLYIPTTKVSVSRNLECDVRLGRESFHWQILYKI